MTHLGLSIVLFLHIEYSTVNQWPIYIWVSEKRAQAKRNKRKINVNQFGINCQLYPLISLKIMSAYILIMA